jgi:hypothetical protein
LAVAFVVVFAAAFVVALVFLVVILSEAKNLLLFAFALVSLRTRLQPCRKGPPNHRALAPEVRSQVPGAPFMTTVSSSAWMGIALKREAAAFSLQTQSGTPRLQPRVS